MIRGGGARHLAFALLFGVVIAGVRVPSSQACSGGGTELIDVIDEGAEGEPPGAIGSLEVAAVRRGSGPISAGCGDQVSDSCDDGGVVILTLTPAVDPDSPPEEVGYRFTVTSGTPPPIPILDPEFPEASAMVARVEDGASRLELHWTDGSTDEQEPLRFALTLTPIDADGHEGPTTEPILIQDRGRP